MHFQCLPQRPRRPQRYFCGLCENLASSAFSRMVAAWLRPLRLCAWRKEKFSLQRSASRYFAAMHLARLRLRDFRNYPRLDADFSPGFHLLLGDNAQGKTNILEAIYLMATLRSFRGVGGAQMIRHSQSGYFVGGKVVSQEEHEDGLFDCKERKGPAPG